MRPQMSKVSEAESWGDTHEAWFIWIKHVVIGGAGKNCFLDVMH